MPPETLPIDRKELLNDRKPSSSEPLGVVVPTRWREPPTTPSSHPNNHHVSPLSCRVPVSDIRRPISIGCQKDWKRGNFWETATQPNGNTYPHSDFVNSMDHLQLNDQHAQNSGGQRLEKGSSLGSSLDRKPLKWTRSGSLCSRGSLDSKIDGQIGNSVPLQSTSGDTAPSLTPRTPDDATSRKKARLGWGEGLAKYEKKKVDPDDFVDKEAGVRDGSVDGVSSPEQLLPSPSSLPGKSPTLTGFSDCASPTTPCSFACSSSPEEKTSITPAIVDNDVCNLSVASCHLSQNHTFKLENTEGFNLSYSLDELLQTDDTSGQGSGFAMDKLQVWKADISRSLEITETEIDSLENELKSFVSDVGGSAVSTSLSTEHNNKSTEEISMKKSDGLLEDSKEESPGTSTSKFVDLDKTSEKAECSQDHDSDDMLGVVTGSSSTVSREDKLYDSIFAPNKAVANETSDELRKMLLLTTQSLTNNLRVTDESLIKKRFAMWKRSLKVKERIITFKFRTLQYSWKKDLRMLSVKSVGAKSHKKFESSSRMGYADHQKHRTSTHYRFSSSGGSLKLVPTSEMVDYVKKLLSDSRVRIYRKELKMPSLMLDKGERLTSMFSSNNGLVENPIDVEKEKSIINLWTAQDKELFLEKYSLFGKNFRKIASFFKHKTVADCVEFYYKNHKSDYFQKTKKKPEFAKGKSYTTNTYLVTSEKLRLNREIGATSSLDMLGSASAMVSNVDGRLNRSSDKKLDNLNNLAIYCNEQEAAAADVLAGICGSISEALGSCITSSVDQGRRCQKLGNGCSLNDVDEETCSDDSCGEETNSCVWTDEEKSSFVKAVKCYGKDFLMVSCCMRSRSSDQCRLFFSKARKCLGLDVIGVGSGSEGTTGANQGGGSGSDDACMVDSGSVISHDKSSGEECKMKEPEDLHSSDSKKELVELSHGSEAEVKLVDRSSNVNLEGAADSEATEAAANPGESPLNTHSDSASGAEVEPANPCKEEIRDSESQLPGFCPVEDLNSASFYSRNLSVDHGTNLDLNAASENISSKEQSNDFVMSNLFPKRTLSQDDASSRLSFRKGGQRSLSTDGYNLHLPKRSLLDYAESSQILRGCPVRASAHSNFKLDGSLLMDPCLPRDGSIQKTCIVSQEQNVQRRSSSLDLKKPSRSGDVKLFGQILTNNSSNKLQQPLPKESEKSNSGMSVSLKFEQSNLQLSSHGFWDRNRIQTGLLPDSAVLLAKYPAAFQDPSNLKIGNNLNVLSGFPTRKLSSDNGGASFHHVYGRQEAVQPFTVVDKLLPEIEHLSSSVQQQGRGMNVVGGGTCNGVSDPVAAIRLHYAKTQQYKNGGRDNWISNAASDIGSR